MIQYPLLILRKHSVFFWHDYLECRKSDSHSLQNITIMFIIVKNVLSLYFWGICNNVYEVQTEELSQSLERLENLEKDNIISLDPAYLTIQQVFFYIPVSPVDELKYRNIDENTMSPFYFSPKDTHIKVGSPALT